MPSTTPATPGDPNAATAGDPRAAAGPDPRGVTRYPAMAGMVAAEPLAPSDFAGVLAAHAEFIASGGAGGRWETLLTTADQAAAIVFGVYVGKKVDAGRQAQLAHSRLDGLPLRGVQLPYADLCGAHGRGQDLSGANLAGSLLVDSDFVGADFTGANLAGADLSRADLMQCSFRQADLRGADLEQADLTGADLRGALTEGARWPNAITTGALR